MEPTTSQPDWLELRNVAEKSADVYIYAPVGSLAGNAANTLAALAGLKVETLSVRINSPGGGAFAGLTVYNVLKSYPGRVIVHIDGVAASIASVIAMAGAEIRMAANAMLMIHAPSGVSEGRAGDMRNTADMLEKLGNNIRDIYAARSGLKPEAVGEYLKTDSWFTADEALALGLCTHIDGPNTAAASFDLSRFRNVPKNFMSTTNTNPTVETFTAEHVTNKVREATEAAHAAAKTKYDEAVQAHASALKGKDVEISTLKQKLADAEANSAAKIGAAPIAHVTTGNEAKKPSTNAEIFAHYKTLKGDERAAYYAANAAAIWAAAP